MKRMTMTMITMMGQNYGGCDFSEKVPLYRSIVIGGGTKRKSQKGEERLAQRSRGGLGESRKNRWPSAPMGGLAFRTRNSPSQKTSLRWGDCCPPNPNPPSSEALWKNRQRDMPPVSV
ncbi:hypothetical protein M0802_006124 [Mischocyttarus mexicanus]|nr:hypothetical protein M0802_006124 [Mischocyttarus mexicanus]